MRVIFFSPQFLPLIGGLENVVKDWAYGLTQAGCQVKVITSTKGDSDEIFPFEVYRNISQFQAWRLMRNSDVIMLFNVSLKGILPCLLSFKSIVVSHQSTNFDVDGKWNRFGRIKQFFADYIVTANIACSNYVASLLRRAIVIHNPYDASLFRCFPVVKRKRELVFLGRLVSDKGCHVIINALSVLKKKYFVVPRLTVIGDGPEMEHLKVLSVKEGIEDQIIFSGAKRGNDLIYALNEHKILIIPSVWQEPFGIVALEGLACGCVVMASNVGGLPEAVGVHGKLFEKGNAEDLASGINEILNGNFRLADREAVEAHLNNFTVTVTAGKLMSVLNASVG